MPARYRPEGPRPSRGPWPHEKPLRHQLYLWRAASHRFSSYDSAVRRSLFVVRYMWAAPTTAIGLLVLLAGLWRAQARVVEGVLEAHGPMLAWLLVHLTRLPGGAAALTLGHVVIARDRRSLEETRAHERVHVRQCETWGPLFVPAYLTASLWAVWRGRNFYFDNRFEVEAFQTGTSRHGAQFQGVTDSN